MNSLLKWGVTSVVGLTAIELTLTALKQPLYTFQYQAVRQNPATKYLPLVAAGVVFAHLEGWIPEQVDPLYCSMRVVRGTLCKIKALS